MLKGGKFLVSAAALIMIGCNREQGKLEIRALPTALAAADRAVPLRIAEARGQLALGNVALALEAFRKALREDPESVDALTGMASCYDKMGRFDLSRRNYEAALAIAPTDQRLLGLLAASLDMQGRRDEASKVRSEIAAAAALAVAGNPIMESSQATASAIASVPEVRNEADTRTHGDGQPAPVAEAPARADEQATVAVAASRSVTIALPPARAVPVRDDQSWRKVTEIAPRLERVSMGEVALVTAPRVLWRSEIVSASARSSTIRFLPLSPAPPRAHVQLLNAARVNRLAARTRDWLAQRGWRGMAIGDAPAVRSRSLILYPVGKRLLAQRLSSQLGFAMVQRASGGQIIVLLGHDATLAPALRATRA